MTMQIYSMVSTAILAAMAGFWAGRILVWRAASGGQEEAQGQQEGRQNTGEQNSRGHKPSSRGASAHRAVFSGRSIGSPVSGMVSMLGEGSYNGALISPVQGCVYAPASGKITRLFPTGNAFILRTETGVELKISVGGGQNEMYSRYYRPRVLQNEVVNKGKLLLEFDKEGLMAEGVDTEVSVCVEAAGIDSDVAVTARGQIKAGEELLRVKLCTAE